MAPDVRAPSTSSAADEATPLLVSIDAHLTSGGASVQPEHDEEDCRSTNDATSSDLLKTELKLITVYSLPLIVTYLLQYAYNLVIVFVAGHIGTAELASLTLGINTMNIIGYAIFEGLATSLDTLCSQAYGSSDNLKLVGIHVQRMFLFLMLVAIPIGTLWMYSPYLLTFIVPKEDLALLAGTFLRVSVLSIPGYAGFEAGKRFLQAQGDFWGGLISLVVSAPLVVFFNWIFVFRLEMGVAGAAFAAALATTFRPFILIFYIYFAAPQTLQCWPGFFPAAVFQNWKPMVYLSIPSAALTILEWFSFEVVTFSTSYLGTTQIAAQSILSTVAVVMWHIPFSASIAVSTRIGQLVGGGSVVAAKRISRLYAALFLLLGLSEWTFTILAKPLIGRIFTTDKEVQRIVEQLVPLVAVFVIFDATASCMQGVIRGLGKQYIGAWVTLFVNYAYGLPLALVLELGWGAAPALGLYGLWGALGSGLALLTIALATILIITDWDKAVAEAKDREE